MALIIRTNSARPDRRLLAGPVRSGLRIRIANTERELPAREFQLAIRVAADGTAVMANAESAVEEVAGILQRLRRSAIESTTADPTTEIRRLSDDIARVSDEMNRLVAATDSPDAIPGVPADSAPAGSTSAINVRVGIHRDTASRIAITLGDLRATSLGVFSDFAINSFVATAVSTPAQEPLPAPAWSGSASFDAALVVALQTVEALSAAESRVIDRPTVAPPQPTRQPRPGVISLLG